MKISETFRKRALYGVAIFCITAIATVGALSIGGNEEDNTPDSLVDLNETNEPGDTQVADGGENQPEVQNPDVQVGDNTEVQQDPEQTAQNPEEKDSEQVALGGEEGTGVQQPEEKDPSEVAVITETPADTKEPEQTEVLSPQLIAEQLTFDKSAGLLWPIAGEVIIPYSPDHGVFYQTLDQFSTSEALVLSSAVGTEVKAAAKGVVTAIEEDVRTGTTVTLALGNNTSLVYGQLDVTELKEGDILEAGDCIGTVAEPTRYYVVEGPNLYFKVMEGETSIDPTELLTEE
ncbi:MAG: peptidoglycan DD-metalloendopeptidase family protein [Lachnospiraceae bacterium]|nr:peptidoglycan DD-metalloendopeptidase family protein [Lachnospiraceae bacterium]MBP3578415.1 peptidoglycan DD-metalloendopeptidase family protein [Lachnospiraceae bacterium]